MDGANNPSLQACSDLLLTKAAQKAGLLYLAGRFPGLEPFVRQICLELVGPREALAPERAARSGEPHGRGEQS